MIAYGVFVMKNSIVQIPAGNSSLVVRALCRCPLGHAGWMQRRPKVRPPLHDRASGLQESPTQSRKPMDGPSRSRRTRAARQVVEIYNDPELNASKSKLNSTTEHPRVF